MYVMNYIAKLPFAILVHCAIFLTVKHAECMICTKIINIKGIGSTSIAQFMHDMGILFAANRTTRGISIIYSYWKIGSTFGKSTIMAGDTDYNFAGSELPTSANEQEQYRTLITIPVLAGALAIAYHKHDVTGITLRVEDVAKIFTGEIRKWNDASLLIKNPTLVTRDKLIRPVVRKDSSGSTNIFTTALSKVNEVWDRNYGVFSSPNFTNHQCCESNSWPEFIEFYGEFSSGIIDMVNMISNTIGYTKAIKTVNMDSDIALIVNSVGDITEPTSKYVQAAIDGAMIQHPDRVIADLSSIAYKDAYPFSFVSYLIFDSKQRGQITCCQLRELVALIHWLQDQPDQIFEMYHLVPLSNAAKISVSSEIHKIECEGENVYDAYLDTLTDKYDWKIIVLISTACAFVVLCALVSIYIVLHRKHTAKESQWLIPHHYLITSRSRSDAECMTIDDIEKPEVDTQLFAMDVSNLRHHGKCFVAKYDVSSRPTNTWHHSIKVKAGSLKTNIRHGNVLELLGVVNVFNGRVVYNFCSKGTLNCVLMTSKHVIDDVMQYHFCICIARGMEFLHKKRIYHGRLSSVTCYVDRSWIVKIANWERRSLQSAGNGIRKVNQNIKITNTSNLSNHIIEAIYAYPLNKSILENDWAHNADLHSFGLLMCEIFNRTVPFVTNLTTPSSLTAMLKQKNYEGIFISLSGHEKSMIPPMLLKILDTCCSKMPLVINFSSIATSLESSNPAKTGVIDSMLMKMETYTKHLEEQTHELEKVTEKMKNLLNEVLPSSIATRLLREETVEPELFDSVSILFIDIVGFTTISSAISAAKALQLLNLLWTAFDSATARHDTYKIDTIGDVYLVCSGLPERNGSSHIKHVINLAVDFIDIVQKFQFEIGNDQKVKIRLGINSGSVTAGIVGTKMPQYCVFGEAVNTAQRMESSAEPMRIHMSSSSVALFQLLPRGYVKAFKLASRGQVQVKGNGLMNTYWLDRDFTVELPK